MNPNYNLRFLKNDKCDNFLLLFIFICGFILGLLLKFLNSFKIKAVKDVFANINLNCDCKMVFCVRTDIKMNKGKICSQCCHACLSVYEKIIKRNNQLQKKNLSKNCSSYFEIWKKTGQKKIVLKISSLEEMYEIEKKAQMENLLTSIIIDAGRTQIDPNTPTVIAIEPVPDEIVNKITGQLKLL
ncbi:peptidyl-tRNA hydrolase 2, putative [Plasmodium gallinaceum]|uniref:peptidyl-tRNA hydrolase n=1 Tax=Plasmodium gallinaceum TaxID=5849 RepID=A0A1J1H3T2_PLAGA|nr:peptidyl-tRNA hydrolase 2, putative [Plasmodium gallinaceum]CRG98143.1 peptidyl-tRNA hydrolase 2, putative [Plasmodium gallinaceum]